MLVYRKNHPLKSVSLAMAITMLMATFAILSSGNEASAKSSKYHKGYKHIRIESRYDSSKYIIAPIRKGRYNSTEIRLPNGRWYDCEGNCRWKAEKEYLNAREYLLDPENFDPGYLRFNIYID